MITIDSTKDTLVTFFHPVTNKLVRGWLKSRTWSGWWVMTDDGFGWWVGSSDLNWKTWMRVCV